MSTSTSLGGCRESLFALTSRDRPTGRIARMPVSARHWTSPLTVDCGTDSRFVNSAIV